MKVLMRNLRGNPYVWVEATRAENGNYIVDGNKVDETSIVSVVDAEKVKYVKCSNCGAIIPNRKKAIEAHKNVSCDWKSCLSCSHLREKNVKSKNERYVLNDDGTFRRTAKANVTLCCNCSYYRSYDIMSPEARERCRYAGCKNATFIPIKGFFDEHPDAFDDIITVDKIIDAGFTRQWNGGSCTNYQLKARNTIVAKVNAMNVVESFNNNYRNDNCTVVYSKALNKLFTFSNGTYQEFTGLWHMPASTVENIKKKISSLYN